MLELEELNTDYENFENSIAKFKNVQWKRLGETLLKKEIGLWLQTLKRGSAKTYTSCLNQLIFNGFLDPLMTLNQFAFLNYESIIDRIKNHPYWKEANKQTKAAAYIGLTRYLARKYPLFIRKAVPSRAVVSRTFFSPRKITAYEALNQSQWKKWLLELKQMSFRDYLIGGMLLQGAKRISEVLGAKIEQINWEKRAIAFQQLKTNGVYSETIISYPSEYLEDLREYLKGRTEGYIFITSTGKAILARHIQKIFLKAGENAAIPFRVSPHVLRVTAITYLRQQGYPDHEICRVSGHANLGMISYYDKTSMEKNPTREVALV